MTWQIDPNASYEPPPIPRSVYKLKITKAEEKTTQSGGVLLSVNVRVLDDGEFNGREKSVGFNVVHPNPTAQNIALAELQKLWKAVGDGGILKTASQLNGLIFTAEFGQQKEGSDYYKFFSFPSDEDELQNSPEDDDVPF